MKKFDCLKVGTKYLTPKGFKYFYRTANDTSDTNHWYCMSSGSTNVVIVASIEKLSKEFVKVLITFESNNDNYEHFLVVNTKNIDLPFQVKNFCYEPKGLNNPIIKRNEINTLFYKINDEIENKIKFIERYRAAFDKSIFQVHKELNLMITESITKQKEQPPYDEELKHFFQNPVENV